MENRFRVVCINDKVINDPVGQLKEGEIYTVVGINEYDGGYFLLEIKAPKSSGAYYCERFRHIDSHFGEWVEETIMKEVEYSEALKEMQL